MAKYELQKMNYQIDYLHRNMSQLSADCERNEIDCLNFGVQALEVHIHILNGNNQQKIENETSK
jgi:hypothetical protein